MLGIHKGHPAIYCRETGQCVVVFRASAHGWSKAIKLALDIEKELQRV